MDKIDIGIHTSAMLAEVNICNWTGVKLDKRASQELDESKGTMVSGVNKVHKELLAGTKLLSNLIKFTAKVRGWHLDTTLPWSDKGPRLLPTEGFFDHKETVSKYRLEWEEMRDALVNNYTDLQTEAAYNLGASYNPDDYPSVNEIESKFTFNYIYTPIPTSGDFRIDVGHAANEELRKQFESDVQVRVGNAMETAWDRLHKTLKHMSEGLEDKNKEGDKKTFRDTLLHNAKVLVKSLKHFNINNDAKMEEARRSLELVLNPIHDAQDLRDFRNTRLDVKNSVDEIRAKLNF